MKEFLAYLGQTQAALEYDLDYSNHELKSKRDHLAMASAYDNYSTLMDVIEQLPEEERAEVKRRYDMAMTVWGRKNEVDRYRKGI